MDLLDILKLYRDDIWSPATVKLVRHADARWDLEVVLRSGQFEPYQANQAREIFSKARYVVSFIGERGTRSRFFGVYSVDGPPATRARPWPVGFPHPEMPQGRFFYPLTRLSGFEELEDRLIVDWGEGMRSWVQWLKPKKVIELLPAGHVREFGGYDQVLLDFQELVKLTANPDANRVWHRALGAVAGVYLISDTVGGEQYVGSAYGQEGILGRWTSYAKTVHGGNVQLKVLLKNNPGRHQHFRFSILQTLPRSMTKNEVIGVETLWKEKLGTRAFGLNGN